MPVEPLRHSEQARWTGASDLRVVSVNVGQPRQIPAGDRFVLTSIFKSPTESRVAVRSNNLEGDRQSDLRVHGGPYKAVYAYASEHYSYWHAELPGMMLPFGAFGENLTTAGLLEDTVAIGERFRIGSAILEVTQPRMPCFKLALRFGRSDMVKKFWKSGYSGFYLAVVEEGELGAGDAIEKLTDPAIERISVAEVVGLHKGEITDAEVFERSLRAPLRGSWKKDIRERWADSSLPLF
jgi:MOSC domain-containing protein YiiM